MLSSNAWRGLRAFAVLFAVGCGSQSSTPGPTAQVTQAETPDGHALDRFEERNDDPITAAAHRYQQRLSADGTVPERALMRSIEQRDELLTNNIGAGIWPESWEWVGPGNIGGRLRPIVIHPDNDNIIYVGSASGGIWKTTDGGQSWFPLDDFLPTLAIADMLMHPEDSDTLYAATGEGFFETVEGTSNTAALRGAGIFISQDAGSTWAQIPSTDNPDFYFVNRIEFDPNDANIMLAATGAGVFRSTDAGQTWSLREAFNALDVKFDPNNSMFAVAGGHHLHDGPYYSTDNGVSWTQASGAGGHRQELAFAPQLQGMVYAAVSDDPGTIKIWLSTDGGQTYTLQTSGGGLQTWASYNNTIWVDPTDFNTLVVGGVRLHRSTNGGVTFTQRFNSVHPDMHRIVHHPDFDGNNNETVFFATDGGIYRTDNIYGNSATNLNNNLGVTQFYGAAVNTAGTVFGGTQDNGTLLYTGDPQDWFHAFGGDGGYCAADQTDPNYVYGEVQRARVFRSTNGGNNSNYIYNTPNGIDDAGGLDVNFIPFLMLDPNNPNRMLVAAERLWRSNNVKDATPDWFPIKDSVEPPGAAPLDRQLSNSHFDPNSPWNIATIAVAEGNSDVIWVGHNIGEIWYTTNGTDANPDWTRVDENGVGLPDRWPSTIVIDRNDHNHVYVAFMGWEPDNVWESTNAGQTWSRITGDFPRALPSAPVSGFALNPNRAGWLYAGTDIGVFVSGDNGQSWTTATNGPGTVPVEQLIWKDDNTLMAVTHGRGIYFGVIQVPEVISDLTVTRGNTVSGGIAELSESDDNSLKIHSEKGDFLIEPFVMEFTLGMTTSETSPSLIDIVIESRVELADSGIQRVYLRNWASGQFEQIRQFGTSTTDTVEPILDIDAANYVRGDGRVEVQIFQTTITPQVFTGFDGLFDRINVFVR